ncbi:MAG: thiamine-phosphate synthase [Pirellulaceae bacterium]|nr:MAG: thiamine-phosphate synthase [Pirellulaceae bacterium]
MSFPQPAEPPGLSVQQHTGILRLLDANLNRATEGLRVLEDHARFVLDDPTTTEALKRLRHDLDRTLRPFLPHMLAARNTGCDVGRELTTDQEKHRGDVADVVAANWKRVQEALRSLEEFTKLLDPAVAEAIKVLRYRCYELQSALSSVQLPRRQLLQTARLYVLVGAGDDPQDFLERCRKIVEAQPDVVQLRAKALDDRELFRRACQLREICEATRTLLIINDRPDMAVAASADGVHVGQEELPIPVVRRLVGPQMLVGCSTHNVTQFEEAVRDGADYVGCGPTFPSATKNFSTLAGLDYLRQIAQRSALPAFAIGGITLENLDKVLATGMRRIAVSHAVWNAPDPAAAVRAFLERLPPLPTSGK